MKHFTLITRGVRIGGVLRELKAHPELWDAHRARTTAPGTPHKTSSDIWVRYNDVAPFADGKRPWSEFNDEHVPINYEAWRCLPSLQPIVFALMAKVRGEMLGGVLITKIPPGSGIERHTDSSWHVDYFRKFYLSLRSAPGSIFGCEHDGVKEELNPKSDEIWEFDNHRPHWVVNASNIDRVTCIICVHAQPFGD